jgi:hypothetical protein
MRKESCDVEQLINITLGVTNKDKCRDVWSRPVFLNMCSAKGCQGFRETEVRNGGRVLLAVPYFYVRIKLRVATLDNNQSLIVRSQSVAASIQKLPDRVVQSANTDRHGQSMDQAKRSGYRSV